MSEITSNSAASKNEIKIEMTFEEAVEITQETYNRYNKKDINDQIGKFDFYDKDFDNEKFFSSNFSGITYIRECENSLNVAIACRGSSKNLKDWVQNLLIIPISPYTFADWKARQYAINILNKIKNDDKYKDKKINIITLGHSKGGREAQKQMLALLSKYKDDNKVNVCCLTFNSAPIVFYEFCQIGKHKDSCQNLYVIDNLSALKDVLKLIDFKYGKNTPYKIKRYFDRVIDILCLIIAIITTFRILPFTLKYIQNDSLAILLALLIAIIILSTAIIIFKLPIILIFSFLIFVYYMSSWYWYFFAAIILLITIYLLIKYAHGIHHFKDEKSSYQNLKDKNISEIIHAKDLQSLVNQNPPKK